MNGAELLIRTARNEGVDVCFANPGTTELPLVAALEETPGMRSVLGLFEGVCTGAADGYARMTGKPALTLLHLGPGFANGVANLHNARRARTPLVNLIGDHASWHRAADPPLNMDIESLAGTVSGWQRNVAGPNDAGRDMAEAVAAATAGQIATLIVPHDFQEQAADNPLAGKVTFAYAPTDNAAVEAAAFFLRDAAGPVAVILGGRTLLAEGLRQAARIRAATGCDLLAETFAPRVDRAPDLPIAVRIPYFPEQAISLLQRYRAFVLIEAREPVGFFGYAGVPGRFLHDDQERRSVGGNGQDALAVITGLADALDAPTSPPPPERRSLPPVEDGPLTVQNMGHILARHQPDNAIIINEGVTSGRAYGELANHAAPHTMLTLNGGSIGWGIPQAVGAAVACPDRPVIALQADGSGLYTVQGLWTQAREQLNVTTLIAANRRYQILEAEMDRAGMPVDASGRGLTALDNPPVDWVSVAHGFGVPAARVETGQDLRHELLRSLAEPGPHLIEMTLSQP
ncbi:MAG: acetolactate synthase large subunit [Caldilineaceae bacterium]|nr:acetolactate synthase large subunit [Caldilineaceae bacterium]